MNFFSIRTNDQITIGKILNRTEKIVFDRLSWHKDEIAIGDFVFIVISGDSSKKIHTYDNGLRAIGKVLNPPKEEEGEKHFNLEVEIFEFLPKTLMKEDFYIYPSLKDAPNIGPETKQAPNQAFRKIDNTTGKSLIRALFDILPTYIEKTKYNSIVDNNYNIDKLKLNSKNEDDVKKDFFNFLKSNGRIETTAKQYISKLTEVGNWFIENEITEPDFNIWLDINQIDFIDKKLNNDLKSLWTSTNKPIKNWFSSPWNAWNAFNSGNKLDLFTDEKEIFSVNSFFTKVLESNLNFSKNLVLRFIASIASKPFVILSGLSGSGKTKIAQAFVEWICESKEQYKIVPVGADWTNREPLVGYPNGLVSNEYITPDSGVIHLLLEAVKRGNENKPFFLILDEMNMSHVERYFADFLSIMESKDTIKLYTGNTRESLDGLPIPLEISWPKNVFIIGTVNIDETTYMFSPKVLDRANVIEFRITDDEIQSFLGNPSIPDLTKLTKQGVAMSESFLSIASQNNIVKNEDIAKELVSFFSQLQLVGAEFGYRSATEMMQLVAKLKMLEPTITDNACLDIAIMQKLLPKLHGSRSKLVKVLIALAALCIEDKQKEDFIKSFENYYKNDFDGIDKKFNISFEKLIRMYKNVLANGFTSYAEA
jgi:5-methylcytosine-specific restriction protein B